MIWGRFIAGFYDLRGVLNIADDLAQLISQIQENSRAELGRVILAHQQLPGVGVDHCVESRSTPFGHTNKLDWSLEWRQVEGRTTTVFK